MKKVTRVLKSKLHPDATVSALESHLGFWLRFVSNHVSGSFKKSVEENGVSISEWVVLRYLFDGVSTSFELIDASGMTKGAISKIVTRLEDKQLIERMIADTDKRVQQLQLTPTGHALVPKLAAIADQNEEKFFSHLTEHQQAHLIKVMKRIVNIHGLKQQPVD